MINIILFSWSNVLEMNKMNEIKCPKCHTAFQIKETDYDSIVKQTRDKEFTNEKRSR